MPGSTTTCGTVRTDLQFELADSSTNVYTEAEFLDVLDLCQLAVYNDIIQARAWILCDALFDSIDITMVVDQEDYDWHGLIGTATKTYYAFVHATWADHPVRVLPRHKYWHLVEGRIQPSIMRPFMVFWADGNFKLRPKPASTTETFTFYFVKPLTDLATTSSLFQLDERCIPLIKAKFKSKYWERRRRYEMKILYDNDDPRQPGEYQKLRKKIILPHKRYKMTDIITTSNV
jgi:hypothetical protein